jgi:hypothetical protein
MKKKDKSEKHFVVCLFESERRSGSETRSKRQQKIPRFECIQLFFYGELFECDIIKHPSGGFSLFAGCQERENVFIDSSVIAV